MRNDTAKWDAPPGAGETLRGAGLSVAQHRPARQTLISGPNVLDPNGVPKIGWPDIADTPCFDLVLRRDRVLRINGPEAPEGWDDTRNQAVSDMSAAYAVLHLDGAGVPDLMQRGGAVFLGAPSASVARLLFGEHALFYRRAGQHGFALHVARARLPALWHVLTQTVMLLQSD